MHVFFVKGFLLLACLSQAWMCLLQRGLGPLPPHLPSVCNMLLFNSTENPYKDVRFLVCMHAYAVLLLAYVMRLFRLRLWQYNTLDNLLGAVRRKNNDDDESSKLAAAPESIMSGFGMVWAEYDIASLYTVSFYYFVIKACARRPDLPRACRSG